MTTVLRINKWVETGMMIIIREIGISYWYAVMMTVVTYGTHLLT